MQAKVTAAQERRRYLGQDSLAQVARQAADGFELGVGLAGARPDVAEVVEDALLQRDGDGPELHVLSNLGRLKPPWLEEGHSGRCARA